MKLQNSADCPLWWRCCKSSSIKTRIETLVGFTRRASFQVAKVVPLKQGLKRRSPTFFYCFSFCSCKSSSIKTRIETFVISFAIFLFSWVAKVVPLKQGLKLGNCLIIGRSLIRCKSSSIKTRIETPWGFPRFYLKPRVAKVVPLKQGLKHLRIRLGYLLFPHYFFKICSTRGLDAFDESLYFCTIVCTNAYKYRVGFDLRDI